MLKIALSAVLFATLAACGSGPEKKPDPPVTETPPTETPPTETPPTETPPTETPPVG